MAVGGIFSVRNFAGSIQTLFQLNDKNQDGALSFEEFHNGIGLSSGARGLDKQHFEELDRNDDGRVTQAEYIAGVFEAMRGDLFDDEDEKRYRPSILSLRLQSDETTRTLIESQRLLNMSLSKKE